MAPKGKRAGIYTRISVMRDEKEESTDRQEEACRAYALAQGWEVVEVFTDRGISGYNGKTRPGWARLEKAVQSGSIDVVIVFAISRAGRNTGRLLAFLEECRDHGVAFVSATEGIDTGTSMGKVIFTILGAVAELESEMKSERLKPQKAQARAAGKWLGGGRRPFGYDMVKESGKPVRFVKNKDEVKVIHDAAQRIIGGETLNAVTVSLNDRKIVTAEGGRWRPAHVRRTLLRDLPSSRFPAILSDDERKALKAKLAVRARPGRPSESRRYALGGVAVCAECGTKMEASAEFYRCSLRSGGCGHVSISAKNLEGHIVERLQKDLGKILTAHRDPEPQQEPDQSVLDEITRLEDRKAELADAFADGGSAADYKRTVEKINARIAELSRQYRGATSTRPPETPEEVVKKTLWMYQAWFNRELTDSQVIELREGFGSFIKKIAVKGKKAGALNERVSITYR